MKTGLLLLIIFSVSGCYSASSHRKAVQDDEGNRITVGNVQRTVKIGMTSVEVLEALGSPNIVTTDEERREVWVYDKIATDVTQSSSGGFGTLILFGASSESASASKSQRTLTVIIKFDNDKKVRDFAYHTSRF